MITMLVDTNEEGFVRFRVPPASRNLNVVNVRQSHFQFTAEMRDHRLTLSVITHLHNNCAKHLLTDRREHHAKLHTNTSNANYCMNMSI